MRQLQDEPGLLVLLLLSAANSPGLLGTSSAHQGINTGVEAAREESKTQLIGAYAVPSSRAKENLAKKAWRNAKPDQDCAHSGLTNKQTTKPESP